MGKRKLSATIEGNITTNEKLTWTPIMDEALIDAYLHQHTIGNRVGGTFTTHALENIVKELNEKFPEKGIDKEKIQNRMKTVKKNFCKCYDVFKTGLSGFTINPHTDTWEAEPEVWADLIKHHPEAEEWRTKPLKFYDKLVEIYGPDRATGDDALNVYASSMKKKSEIGKSSTDRIETIEEIDFMVSQNHINLENVIGNENEHDFVSPTSATSQSQHEDLISHKSKKGKKSLIQESVSSLTEAFHVVANAIKDSSKEMANAILSKNTGPDHDTWSFLEEIGVEEELLDDAFVFLSKNPSVQDSLVKCRIDRRKSVLLKFMNAQS